MSERKGALTYDGPLYHGGARRLDRVGLILPPARTGARSLADFGGAGVTRRDRVYLTADLDVAQMYALMVGRGDVYEVEPLGPLERDPDYLGPADTPSFETPMARILRVLERNVSRWQGLTVDEVAAVLTADGDEYPAGVRWRAAA